MAIIAIDFDGTCTSHEFPKVGKDIGAVPVLKELIENEHKLILFTMRCDHSEDFKMTGQSDIVAIKGKYLTDAVNWFKDNDIPLYGIQTNPTQHTWTTSPKCFVGLYIDDSALGCPLKIDRNISDNSFVDWKEVRKLLIEKNYI